MELVRVNPSIDAVDSLAALLNTLALGSGVGVFCLKIYFITEKRRYPRGMAIAMTKIACITLESIDTLGSIPKG